MSFVLSISIYSHKLKCSLWRKKMKSYAADVQWTIHYQTRWKFLFSFPDFLEKDIDKLPIAYDNLLPYITFWDLTNNRAILNQLIFEQAEKPLKQKSMWNIHLFLRFADDTIGENVYTENDSLHLPSKRSLFSRICKGIKKIYGNYNYILKLFD